MFLLEEYHQKKREKKKSFTLSPNNSNSKARTPALLTSCLPHFTAFSSICSHNLNKIFFLAQLRWPYFHTQRKYKHKNDPLIFWTKVAFSKLSHCEQMQCENLYFIGGGVPKTSFLSWKTWWGQDLHPWQMNPFPHFWSVLSKLFHNSFSSVSVANQCCG